MIPSTVGFLDQDFEIETQPSLTYKMDLDGDSVRGLVDEQDAMKQMISEHCKQKGISTSYIRGITALKHLTCMVNLSLGFALN